MVSRIQQRWNKIFAALFAIFAAVLVFASYSDRPGHCDGLTPGECASIPAAYFYYRTLGLLIIEGVALYLFGLVFVNFIEVWRSRKSDRRQAVKFFYKGAFVLLIFLVYNFFLAWWLLDLGWDVMQYFYA